jgi:OmpA-OmpF porin, OOP family
MMQPRTPSVSRSRLGRALTLAALAASAAFGAHAQTAERGYVGAHVGRSDYKLSCGTGAFGCDTRDTSARLSLGHYLAPNMGLEMSLFDGGKVSRLGGSTRARSVDLALFGRVPVGPLYAFAKAGASHGRTTTNVDPLSAAASGKASGWGPMVGAGLAWDFSSSMSLVGEWERRKLRFAGGEESNVDNTSLGLRVRF